MIWVTPAQMTVRPLAWPQPQEFLDPGDIRTFGYEDAVVLASTVTLAASGGEPSPTLLVQADVQWLACRDICIPGSASLVLPLGVSADQPAESPQAELFRQHGTY